MEVCCLLSTDFFGFSEDYVNIYTKNGWINKTKLSSEDFSFKTFCNINCELCRTFVRKFKFGTMESKTAIQLKTDNDILRRLTRNVAEMRVKPLCSVTINNPGVKPMIYRIRGLSGGSQLRSDDVLLELCNTNTAPGLS